jgi:hypothetical protein
MPATDNAIADAALAAPENEEFIADTLVPNSRPASFMGRQTT